MPRFVPIVITVKGGEDANRVARQIVNAFKEIDRGADASAKSTEQATKKTTNAFKQIEHEADRSAKGASGAFSKYLSAEFFGSLARDAFRSFMGHARQFFTESVQLARELQDAMKGLGSLADFYGIPQGEIQQRVAQLDAVRLGFLSQSDAIRAVKPVLQFWRGDMDKAIGTVDMFSKTAVFGRQATLGYAEAIASATEGLKNMNPITMDNAGFTKNASVIGRERGFQLQDLDDKIKGVTAREQLYIGMQAESAAQMGDLIKASGTYSAALIAEDTAYQNLQRTIGLIIINNAEWVESTRLVAKQINNQTEALQDSNSETAKFANDVLSYAASIKAQLLPFAAFVVNMFKGVGQGLTALSMTIYGSLARLAEMTVDSIIATVEKSVNVLIAGTNKVFGDWGNVINRTLGLPEFKPIAEVKLPRADFKSEEFFKMMQVQRQGMDRSFSAAERAQEEGYQARVRLADARWMAEFNRSLGLEKDKRDALTRNMDQTSKAAKDLAGNMEGAKGRIDEENIKEARRFFDDLRQAFSEHFGRALPARWGPSNLHARQGMDHRAAADIGLNPLSPEGRWVTAWLKEQNVPFSAWTQRTVSPVTGKLLATGPHIHFGAPSGKRFGGPEGLTGRELDEAIAAEEARKSHRFYGKSMSDIAATIRGDRAKVPLETTEPELAGLPPRLQRLWDNYYDHISQREKETAARREDFATEFYAAQQNLALDLENVELDLAQFRAQNADDQFVEQRRLLSAKSEEIELLQRTAQVQDEIANGPYNQSLRIELALLEDIAAMRRRDEEAIISTNRAQLELADQTIYHSTQANAQVLEFLANQKSITQIVADAKTGFVQTTFDYIDSGLAKANSKLGRMGNLLTQIESDFIRLAATKFFQWIFGVGPSSGGGQASGAAGLFPNIFGGGGPGGTPTFAGGFQSSGGGSIGQQLLNMLRGGGRTQYAAGMPFLGGFGADGITAPTSSLSGGAGLPIRPTPWGDILSASGVKLPGGSAGIGARGSIAAMLPLLGLGLGSQLGGQSRFGGILGGAGGLLAGGIGTALLAPSLFGIGTAGGSSAMMAGLFGLLTNPITAIVAGGLLVGALLLNRNAQRRKNETDRASLGESTYQSIINVLNAARDGSYTSVTAALADFDKIKADYFSHISGYDSKTKRIATETWNGKPEQPGYEAYRKLISDTAAQAIANRELGKNMIPEFSHGGLVPFRSSLFSMVTGLTPIKVRPGEVMIPPGGFGVTVPGVDRGYDSVYTMARPGTKVLTRSQAAGARGFLSGGTVDADDSGPTIINVYLENQLTVGKETAGQIVEKGATTSNGQKVIVRVVAGAQADGEIR